MSQLTNLSIYEEPPIQSSRLKELTKSEKWVSPFRNSTTDVQRRNSIKELQKENSLDNIQVPKKFLKANGSVGEKTSTPSAVPKTTRSDIIKEDEVETAPATAPKEVDPVASIVSLKNEPLDTDLSSEKVIEPFNDLDDKLELKKEAIEYDDIVDAIKNDDSESEHPIDESEILEPKATTTKEAIQSTSPVDATLKQENEIVTPETVAEEIGDSYPKIEAIKEHPNKETIDKLKDKPVLLNRYQDLTVTAAASIDRKLDDQNRCVDLGQGLLVPYSQILALAEKRVQPVLSDINEQVSRTVADDEAKRQAEIEKEAQNHKSKLDGKLVKHQTKLEKQKSEYQSDIDKKLAAAKEKFKQNHATHTTFKTTTAAATEKLGTDFEEREKTAVTKHETDKTDLHEKHEDLKISKAQELEDAKTGQVTTKEEIEELTTKKESLIKSNEELTVQIENLEKELELKVSSLNELTSKKSLKDENIEKRTAAISVLNDSVSQKQKVLETKIQTHKNLVEELNVIKASVSRYTGHVDELIQDKQIRLERLGEAKNKHQAWELDRENIASTHAKEQEVARLKSKSVPVENHTNHHAIPLAGAGIAGVGAGAGIAAGAGASSASGAASAAPPAIGNGFSTAASANTSAPTPSLSAQHTSITPATSIAREVEEVPKDEISLKKDAIAPKSVFTPVDQINEEKEKSSVTSAAPAIAGASTGASAIPASFIASGKNASRNSLVRTKSSSSSLSNFKNKLIRKISRNKSKNSINAVGNGTGLTTTTNGVVSGENSEYDYVTDFEEVTEEEFAKHKGDPNYIEVSEEDFLKNKAHLENYVK